MEEYITRAEFEQFKRQVEQKTEEMKAIRVDVHNVDVEAIRQELQTVSDTWLNTLQKHYDEHKEAISDVKTVQSGHSKFFEEHGKRLAATATRDDISRLETDITSIKTTQEQILKLLQQKPSEGQP
jgi:hypothetical protein